MELNIKLNAGYGRLSNKSPFLLADNEKLTLLFDSGILMTDTIITAKNNDKIVKYRVPNLRDWEVPGELYEVGLLEIIIEVLVNAQSVRKFYVEPIIIKEIDSGFEGYGVLNKYDEAIAQISADYTELAEKCEQYEQRLADIDAFLKRMEDY